MVPRRDQLYVVASIACSDTIGDAYGLVEIVDSTGAKQI